MRAKVANTKLYHRINYSRAGQELIYQRISESFSHPNQQSYPENCCEKNLSCSISALLGTFPIHRTYFMFHY